MNAVSFDSSDIDEVKTFLQSSDELYFQKMGFVVAEDNEHDELFEWYMRLKYSHDDLNIMLIMTYDCNCACKYCFEKYERIKYTPPDTCFKCSFFPICMGGCQFEAKALGTYCQKSYLKAVYDEYFTKYAK
ncbi:MAG: hypothetical protein ACTTI3_09470 [Treponema sp.]